MICVNPNKGVSNILVVSENGYGKRSDLDDYRVTGRGGKGVKTISITEKTGVLVGIMDVNDDDGLMIINRSGMTIRMAIDKLRVIGRAAQGVKLINIKGNDSIASIAKTPREEEEEEIELDADGNPIISSEISEDSSDSVAPTEE
jgi:DNA gyrase subunit A